MTPDMLTVRHEWLLVGGMLCSCGSPDLAEAGQVESTSLVCTRMGVLSGFGVTFAARETTASLDEALVSVCRDGDPCHTTAIHDRDGSWLCDKPVGGFSCFASEPEGALLITTFVDVKADSDAKPLEDGDVWRATLTDAQGQTVLSHAQAVNYVAVCGNGPPACGVDQQAFACVSEDEVACPMIVPERPCPEDAGTK